MYTFVNGAVKIALIFCSNPNVQGEKNTCMYAI